MPIKIYRDKDMVLGLLKSNMQKGGFAMDFGWFVWKLICIVAEASLAKRFYRSENYMLFTLTLTLAIFNILRIIGRIYI